MLPIAWCQSQSQAILLRLFSGTAKFFKTGGAAVLLPIIEKQSVQPL